MQFDIVTIFPEFFDGPLDYGIVRRARESGLIAVGVHNLRAFTQDRHRTVDDRPFGGGEGMVLKPEPLFAAVESLTGPNPHSLPETAIVLLSASGRLFRQQDARRFTQVQRMIFLCGRYEGVDERVAEHLATDEVSIGDFVLSGGELAAALMIDAVTRLIPGALGNEDSTVNESFRTMSTIDAPPPEDFWEARGKSEIVLLDCPHYTRPADFRGWKVPEVLLSGNHEQVRRWRMEQALQKTRRNRPELLGLPVKT